MNKSTYPTASYWPRWGREETTTSRPEGVSSILTRLAIRPNMTTNAKDRTMTTTIWIAIGVAMGLTAVAESLWQHAWAPECTPTPTKGN